jgi:DNA-binding beta-propeller fold protein YncE
MRSTVAVAAVLAALALPAAAPAQAPQFLFEFGNSGTAAQGNLLLPRGIAVDADGNVWVVDPRRRRVVKYDFNGRFITAIRGPVVTAPTDIAADRNGFVYVTDTRRTATETSRVVQLDTGGRLVRNYGVTGPDMLGNPQAVAVDDAGVLYVGDQGLDRVERYSPGGRRLAPIPNSGTPRGIVVRGDDVYVSHGTALNISRYSARTLRRLSTFGTGMFRSTVIGLAFDPGGLLYAVDFGNRVVRRFTAAGEPRDSFGVRGTGPGMLSGPQGVAVDCRGNVYVVDGFGSKVVKYGDPAAPPPPCEPRPDPGAIDAQVNDIEVTQGIQPPRSFTAVRDPRPGVSLVEPDYEDAAYYGPTVPLARDRTTVVRVYANLRSGPRGGIANVPATLEARRGRTSLGRIQPVGRPAVLRLGDATVDDDERTDPVGAYTFVLPPDWTRQGEISLIANVNPAGIGCDAACLARVRFQLNGVRFRPTNRVGLFPLALTIDRARRPVFSDGTVLDTPGPAFAATRAVTPVPFTLLPFVGEIPVTDLVKAGAFKIESCFLGIQLELICTEKTISGPPERIRELRNGLLMERLEEWRDDNNVNNSTATMGLISAGAHDDLPGAMRGDFFAGDGPVGFADISRPLTAVGHELQHAFGRPHAGQNCNGTRPGDSQVGEPWPPDDTGLMQGIGLDPRAGSGGARGPFRILAPGAAGGPAQWFDLMSYCAPNTPETGVWISPKGWRDVIGYRAPAGFAQLKALGGQSTAGLRVSAVVAGSEVLLADVSPRTGAASAGASPFTLQAVDAGGAVLATVPMQAEEIEVPRQGLITVLEGQVPAAGADAVIVYRDGVPVAGRPRSANAPDVRIASPRRGRRVGRRRDVTIRWRARDRDGGALTARVEYSRDGREWRTIFLGPDRGRAVVRSRLLPRARRARVRVRVSDGFNETVATSARFTALGAAPEIRLLEPRRGQRVRADAPLPLRAEVFDDRNRRLVGRALRWFDGRRRLGRGEALNVTGLDRGRRAIRLVARDYAGRRSTASVAVRVTPVRPAFLRLDAPDRLSRRARKARLRVASTVAATLRVGRQRFRVGPGTRRVGVRVRPGRRQLRLTLRLRAGGRQTQTTVTIAR